MQFNKQSVVMIRGRERCGMPLTHFFPRKNAIPTILMLPLSFNTNHNGITVLKQSANHAIILAKILSYAPRAGFPHFLEALPFSLLV